MDAQAIISAVEGVTKKWCQQRKAEERESSRRFRRREAMVRSQRVTMWDVVFEMMEQFYLAASTDGKYPPHARQIFYRARGPCRNRRTGPLTTSTSRRRCCRTTSARTRRRRGPGTWFSTPGDTSPSRTPS